jgi:regulator of replication initiation timing
MAMGVILCVDCGLPESECCSGRFNAELSRLREEIEDLESEIENLHIENDTLCKRVQNETPDACFACRLDT